MLFSFIFVDFGSKGKIASTSSSQATNEEGSLNKTSLKKKQVTTFRDKASHSI